MWTREREREKECVCFNGLEKVSKRETMLEKGWEIV